MSISELDAGAGAQSFSRRALFSILQVRTAGCFACAHAALCGQAEPQPQTGLSWTDKADMTWEEIFRFAYQKDLIPLLKELGERIGREKWTALLRDASDEVVRKKTARRPHSTPDLMTLAAGMQKMSPLMQHALDAEIVEMSPEAFEYRVKKCLWAKVFRDGDAADIGYAMVCYPDYSVARSLNPKLRLIRTQTLMEGRDSCSLRYVMET